MKKYTIVGKYIQSDEHCIVLIRCNFNGEVVPIAMPIELYETFEINRSFGK